MKVCASAAIDPGVNGGLAVLNDDGSVEVTNLPRQPHAIVDLLRNVRFAGIKKLAIEDLVLFNGIKRPGSTMAVYAASFGFLEGAALALDFTISLISPPRWMSTLSISNPGIPREKWKAYLVGVAEEKFPGVKLTQKTADAALLALAAKNLPAGVIRCGSCFKVKSENEFHKSARASMKCKNCAKLTNWRPYYLRYAYGLSQTDYDKMLARQGGNCAICRLLNDTPLHVDHDHKTNKIRGLLCRGCNFGLGNFEDSIGRLQGAIEYLTP